MFTPQTICYLDSTMSEHRHRFLQVFPQEKLIPKHHYLEHYPQLMAHYTMCFDAKHSFFKCVVRHTHSFRNILLSLSMKHQLMMEYSITSTIPVFRNLSYRPQIAVVKVDPNSCWEGHSCIHCEMLECLVSWASQELCPWENMHKKGARACRVVHHVPFNTLQVWWKKHCYPEMYITAT